MSHSEPKVPVNWVVSKPRERLGGDLVAVVLFGSRARGEAREGLAGRIGRTYTPATQIRRLNINAWN